MISRVASLWIGEELGPYEQVCMSSFIRRGVAFELYSYHSLRLVPKGVEVRDASEIVPKNRFDRWRLTKHQIAGFADLFRYSLLRQRQVVWVDTDVFLLADIRALNGFVLGFELPGRVNNAVIGYPQGGGFSEYLAQQADLFFDPQMRWGEIGPELVSKAVEKFKLWELVQPESAFYPIPMRQAWSFFDAKQKKRLKTRTRNASTIHLWNELIRDNPLELKLRLPEKHSLARDLVDGLSLGELFQTDEVSTLTPTWRGWKRGIDPKNQRFTVAMMVRDLISLCPQPLLGQINRLFFALRNFL